MVARADIHAKCDLDLRGDYAANATLEAEGVPIGAMLASFLPSAGSDVNGEMDARASLSGPLKDPGRIRANAEVPTLKIGYSSLQLANEGPMRLSYRDRVVHVDQARLKGSGTDFAVQGAVPLRGTAPMNLSANGVIDVSLLKLVSPDALASGEVNLNLQARGNLSDPNIQGKIQIVNAAYTTDELPVLLTAVNGAMDVSGNRIEVREIQGKAGGGTISARGSVLYGKQPSFALDLQAQSVRIHPNGVHSTLDGKLQLNGTPENSSLTGQVLVDHLSFQQGSGLSSIVEQFSGESVPSTPSPFESHMKLNVSVQSTDNLNVASSQLSIAGSMNLTVTNTLADPVILGRIALTGGEVFFLGKRFEVQSGTIVFANPVRTEPVVNLFVSTAIEQYNITINFLGPLDRLKTNYTSDPSLAPLDIINLLAFGQTTAEQTANTAAPTSLGAEGVVAQGVASQLASRVQSLAGISQLTIDPLAGTTQNPGAQLAIQQRVSGNLLLTFSTNITTTQNQAVQLEYRPKRQITISVLRDEYGGYGIDVKLHKVF
jgi:translocation and assembly module TamB